jgi:hypothetical protein
MHLDKTSIGVVAASILGIAAIAAGCSNASGSGSTTSATTTSSTTTTGAGGKANTGGAGQGGSGGHASTGGAGQGGSGGTSTGGAGQGGGGQQATPVFCPEKNPFQPTLPNAVQVTDSVLSQDTTWTADKVWLVGSVLDPDGHTLTVEAGTMVCFYNNGGIVVGATNASEIHVNGTADKHVTFTGTSDDGKTPNFWPGVGINGFKSSTLSYLDIFYSGPSGGGSSYALDIMPTAGGDAPLGLDHVLVSQVQSKGIKIDNWDQNVWDGVAKGDLTFDGYFPVDQNTPALGPAFDFDSVFVQKLSAQNFHVNVGAIPADSAFVQLEPSQGGGIGADTTWGDLGLPYRLPSDGLAVVGDQAPGPKLTLGAGVTVQMKGDIVLGDPASTSYANLVLAGTAAKPVTLTSAEKNPAPGDWGAIYFVTGAYDAAISKIDYAKISYGGTSTKTIQQCPGQGAVVGMVEIDGQGSYDGPSITNSAFESSADRAIAAELNDAGKLTNDYSQGGNTFKNNQGGDYPSCK